MRARVLAACGLAALAAAGCQKREPDAPRVEYVEPEKQDFPQAPAALPIDPAAIKIVIKDSRERFGDVFFSVGPEAIVITYVVDPGWTLKEARTCVRLPQNEERVIIENDCIFMETRFMAPGSNDTTVVVGLNVFDRGAFDVRSPRTAVFQFDIEVMPPAPQTRRRHGTAFYEFDVP
ncbi:hypothetical protein HY633_02860 [Candidatus Uhrbacteria bacterium]|nr:hypothetical protein [Candidatus Uhrbacteria bacterium]